MKHIQQRLTVAHKITIKNQIARNVVTTYLGNDAGQRVLDGQIKRGDGETIHAVIWYSDMRNFTGMAESMPSTDFLEALNGYFECPASAVLNHNGEVLRFVGDAVLANFPIRDVAAGAYDACERAIAAARQARDRLAALNRERTAAGVPPLDFGLPLHIRDLMYGNIGVHERSEFSVVGRAANEVARLEGLTRRLKRCVLASREFAQHVSATWESLGQHQLRGVGEPIEVFSPNVKCEPSLSS